MKEYNENRIFDNLEREEKPEFSAFSLESYIRNAAQRMIQAALELEVAEFLQRAKYDKTSQSEFRGYRNGHHQSRTVSTAVGGLTVKVPRVSDNTQKYESKLVKPYQRRSEGLNNSPYAQAERERRVRKFLAKNLTCLSSKTPS